MGDVRSKIGGRPGGVVALVSSAYVQVARPPTLPGAFAICLRAWLSIALGDRDPPCSEIARSKGDAICCGGLLHPPQERPASHGRARRPAM